MDTQTIKTLPPPGFRRPISWILMDLFTEVMDHMSTEICRKCAVELELGPPDAIHPVPRTMCIPCWESCFTRTFDVETFPLRFGSLTLMTCTTYEDFAPTLIKLMKYEEDRLVADDLSILLAEGIDRMRTQLNLSLDGAMLVPIPLSIWREIRRGYNQCRLLAQRLERRCYILMEDRALKRIRTTKAQHSLTKPQRQENLRDAFRAEPKLVLGRKVILLDDVCTSGATMLSAADALLSAGATEIYGLSVCRATLDYSPHKTVHGGF